MTRQVVKIRGKRFVMVEEAELKRLEQLATQAESPLPPLPPADAKGNRPALDYVRASIARDIIRERRALGLTQAGLAKQARVRVETISRLENGRHSPNVATVDKIVRALDRAEKGKRK